MVRHGHGPRIPSSGLYQLGSAGVEASDGGLAAEPSQWLGVYDMRPSMAQASIGGVGSRAIEPIGAMPMRYACVLSVSVPSLARLSQLPIGGRVCVGLWVAGADRLDDFDQYQSSSYGAGVSAEGVLGLDWKPPADPRSNRAHTIDRETQLAALARRSRLVLDVWPYVGSQPSVNFDLRQLAGDTRYVSAWLRAFWLAPESSVLGVEGTRTPLFWSVRDDSLAPCLNRRWWTVSVGLKDVRPTLPADQPSLICRPEYLVGGMTPLGKGGISWSYTHGGAPYRHHVGVEQYHGPARVYESSHTVSPGGSHVSSDRLSHPAPLLLRAGAMLAGSAAAEAGGGAGILTLAGKGA